MKPLNNYRTLNLLAKLQNFSQSKYLILILILSFLISVLDLISIAIVYPFLEVFNKGSYWNIIFFNFFGDAFLSEVNVKKFLIFTFLFFFLLKSFISIFVGKIQYYLYGVLEHDLATKLFSKAISLPYNFIRNKEIKELQSLLNNDTDQFRNIIYSLANLISETIILVFLILFVFIFSGKVIFLFLTILFLIFILSIIITKKKIALHYPTRRDSYAEKLQIIKETFTSIEEIIIYKKKEYALEIFKNYDFIYNRSLSKTAFIQTLPKYIFEIFIVIFICFSLLIFDKLKLTGNLTFYISLSVIFLRLVPSFNRITANYQSLVFSKPAIQNIFDFLQNKNITLSHKNLPENDLKISIKNISFKYDNKFIFKNFSVNIEKIDCIGIFGPSGSGKSTLIKIILGLISPQAGKIIINDKFNVKNYLSSYWDKISYVPQNSILLNKSILENIILQKQGKSNINLHEISKIKSLLQEVDFKNISNFEIQSKNFLGESSNKISGGERQKISLARALYRNPAMLILDESLSSIDQASQEKILKNLFLRFKKSGIFIFVTHNLLLEKYFKKTIKINNFS